ncbi:MAG: hypothetical protein A3G57_04000 [Candidatus Andersenbacteria bacterium RIFCSPLOWO2_12_FULL_45_8]|nr:MAG: hypothetical protein UW94_C0020G0031 [Parcubacteria group bacterium GW2011_GWA2_45_14]OGY35965.1 MAG: hypothetical protein A3B76_04300 [Candidatus Andersenbacteria bacterium RIFCSPHIGHO2_02_FULL_46_16]OGY37633.1 MAG: hypothetical protein A3I08_01035 [Candidatus Andersenbacteria bacterium RIFCSPLOWO2_02_FULL_46_11]OGY42780.1 MAG: hypothetical protein A3G57_04000 [Candidatus Andersenbacteria bacterium RIFCSPLOWO2_12_FULL_45_8]HBE89666.1 hypothetical protein [Candidatus Andersenbacteria ba
MLITSLKIGVGTMFLSIITLLLFDRFASPKFQPRERAQLDYMKGEFAFGATALCLCLAVLVEGWVPYLTIGLILFFYGSLIFLTHTLTSKP